MILWGLPDESIDQQTKSLMIPSEGKYLKSDSNYNPRDGKCLVVITIATAILAILPILVIFLAIFVTVRFG